MVDAIASLSQTTASTNALLASLDSQFGNMKTSLGSVAESMVELAFGDTDDNIWTGSIGKHLPAKDIGNLSAHSISIFTGLAEERRNGNLHIGKCNSSVNI